MTTLADIQEEYDFIDRDDRWTLIIDLGRDLRPMPDALKTPATMVRGCSSEVFVYPIQENGHLTFLADSNSGITKGIIALILKIIEGKSAKDILSTDIDKELAPFNLEKHFTSKRTQGLPNMISLIRATASRYAT